MPREVAPVRSRSKRVAKHSMRCLVCLLLGVVASVWVAILIAWGRPPVMSHPSGTLVAIVPLSTPRMVGSMSVDKIVWSLLDRRRFGERELFWHGDMASGTYPEELHPRPPLPGPIQWVF